jgi:hypothetical protein
MIDQGFDTDTADTLDTFEAAELLDTTSHAIERALPELEG